MKRPNFALSAVAFALCLGVGRAPAGADTSPNAMTPPGAMMTNVDCSKAGDTLTQAGKMDDGATMTGDVDKDFVTLAMLHEKGMMMLQQVELQCGKNAKLKAAVAKSMHDSQMRLQMFRNEGQSG